jgi:hypothetical protein
MPKYTLAEDGKNLLDEEGNIVKIGDEAIEVEGGITQQKAEQAIKDRLARQADRIKTLETQAERTPAVEKMLEELKSEKQQIEQQLSTAMASAQAEVQAQLTKAQREADQFRTAYQAEATARLREQVTNLILGKAGDGFQCPAADLVPRLLSVHKREQVKGEDGKPVEGQFVDLFKLRFRDDKGNETEDFLPVEKAIDAFASDPANRHYLRSTAASGSGGATYPKNHTLNPWAKETWNVTEQMKLISSNREKARQMASLHGHKV